MHKKSDPFLKLKTLSKEIAILTSIHNVLEWDQETYMPEDALESRSSQIELLAALIHKKRTSSSLKNELNKVVNLETGELKDKNISEENRASIREWRRDLLINSKLPSSFVKQFAKTTSESVAFWTEAKKKSDFKLFAPYLEQIVSLSQKKANLLGYKEHPYDALLDLYEPGLTTAFLTPLFKELKEALKDILKKIKNKKTTTFNGTFSKDLQMQAGHLLLKNMGFSEKTTRLDISSHPFCSGIHIQDTRMTTRIDLNDPISSLLSILHEGGHGLYNKNLRQDWYGTPVCDHASYGIDESQSRFWETLIGKSLPFWTFFYPKLQAIFPENLSKVSLEDFYNTINQVQPSFIRVEADEVTYCLHVILRFEIEKGLMDGTIKVKDVPAIWAAKMQESLSITPSNDSEGCLQDIHWAMGGIGYFPTYALGNLLATELFSLMENRHPDWQQKVSVGNLSFLEDFLKENVHKYGKIYLPNELIKKITGKPLNPEKYIKYLQKKYSPQ